MIIKELETNLQTLMRNEAYHKKIFFSKKEFFKNNLDTITYFSVSLIPKVRGFEKLVFPTYASSLANNPSLNLEAEDLLLINLITEKTNSVKPLAQKLHDFIYSKKMNTKSQITI